MIPFDRFEKNINIAHLALISGNDETVLKIKKGLLVYFPKGKEQIEHFMFFTNFGLLKDHEMTIEELYYELIKTNNL